MSPHELPSRQLGNGLGPDGSSPRERPTPPGWNNLVRPSARTWLGARRLRSLDHGPNLQAKVISAPWTQPFAERLFCPMEHKGIQFLVVQTANPTGFKWTV